jgi:hypothetical protein
LKAATGRRTPSSITSPTGFTSTTSDLGVETLCDQDLPGGRLIREPRGEVRHGADRGVVVPALEADLATRRGPERDACSEPEVVAALRPLRRQL